MIIHRGTEPIQTDRLILRRFTPDDALGLYENWAADPESVLYMRMKPHQSREETAAFVESIIRQYSEPATYRWVIEMKDKKCVIGFIGLTILHEQDGIADFGYAIGKAYWNRGYATEALTAVLDYAFSIEGIHRIEAYHSIRNMQSGKVMQKAGMLLECRSRQKYRSNAGLEDCDLYGILKSDWENLLCRKV